MLSRFFLFVVLQVVLTVAGCNVLCKDPCRCSLSNDSKIDLSTVGLLDQPKFALLPLNSSSDVTLAQVKDQHWFSYNPCYPFTETENLAFTDNGEHLCTNVAACILTAGDGKGKRPEIHALGLQTTAQFVQMDAHIAINYSVPKSMSNLTVFLVCNDDNHSLTVEESEGSFKMTLTGRCACPDACPERKSTHRMSTGSILLIISFTIIMGYVVFGVMYKFCSGAKGAELCPHVTFWTELPPLITEGLIYTCACLTSRKQPGYADV